MRTLFLVVMVLTSSFDARALEFGERSSSPLNEAKEIYWGISNSLVSIQEVQAQLAQPMVNWGYVCMNVGALASKQQLGWITNRVEIYAFRDQNFAQKVLAGRDEEFRNKIKELLYGYGRLDGSALVTFCSNLVPPYSETGISLGSSQDPAINIEKIGTSAAELSSLLHEMIKIMEEEVRE